MVGWGLRVAVRLDIHTHTHTHTHGRSTFLSFLTTGQPYAVAQGSELRVQVFQQTRQKL